MKWVKDGWKWLIGGGREQPNAGRMVTTTQTAPLRVRKFRVKCLLGRRVKYLQYGVVDRLLLTCQAAWELGEDMVQVVFEPLQPIKIGEPCEGIAWVSRLLDPTRSMAVYQPEGFLAENRHAHVLYSSGIDIRGIDIGELEVIRELMEGEVLDVAWELGRGHRMAVTLEED